MKRTVDTTTADDGTKLELKERDNGDYVVTEAGSDARTGEVVQSREAGRRQLQETSRLYGRAEDSTSSSGFGGGLGGGFDGASGGGLGGGFDDGMGMDDRGSGGGLFGGGSETGDSAERDSGGGVFGGSMGSGDRESDRSSRRGGSGGSLFGGFGGFGGGGASRKRDPDTGKFAPSRPRDTDFEMSRDENGQFSGRKDEDDGNGGGLFGFLR